MTPPRAFVFDAYGTLFDVHSIAMLAETLVPSIVPMTGLAFVLYTFYMITDPATTSYQFSTLSSGTWYFAVVAVNAGGFEGPPTILASKSI